MTRVLVTPGEPAGIGPDLIVSIAQENLKHSFAVIADPLLLQERAELLNLPITVKIIQETDKIPAHEPGSISVLPITLTESANPGSLNVKNANYVLETLTTAANLCLNHMFDAVVTGPVHKGIINDAGIPFTGHTEFFSEISKTKKVVMMLQEKNLRVALATTHLPLKDVPAAITKENLREIITILHAELEHKFSIQQPNILVCGLNPHAGENGHLGKEEIEVIAPIIEEFSQKGINIEGPLAADTIFSKHNINRSDVILAMYHDQGLPVLKYSGFGNAVNITLGLPFIRTSVDHGTALNLAGKSIANHQSLLQAIELANSLKKMS